MKTQQVQIPLREIAAIGPNEINMSHFCLKRLLAQGWPVIGALAPIAMKYGSLIILQDATTRYYTWTYDEPDLGDDEF